jgi:hypothetical protein
MTRPDDRIQFRPGAAMLASLACRASLHDLSSPDVQAKADLDTMQKLTAAELRRITLTVAEAVFLASLVEGRHPVPGTPMLYLECRHALSDTRADTDGAGTINGGALLARLERLGPAADFFLCDALAGWQARKLDATAEGFTQAGLRIEATAAA